MSKVNKLGQYKGIEVNVEKHIATKEEVEAAYKEQKAKYSNLSINSLSVSYNFFMSIL